MNSEKESIDEAKQEFEANKASAEKSMIRRSGKG
ncbi:hypothetical protein PO124_06245 [Bacillus licheniformis]|nr:hypothetical protein [Bacillus licheniformis]